VKITIDVADRKEADAIRRGLADPQVRALVCVTGILAALPSDRARLRVLRVIDDKFNEDDPTYVSVFNS
jgi:hypothetical protein